MLALGNKYECFSCEVRFYDLGRPAAVCPSCGTDQADYTEEEKSDQLTPRNTARPATKKKATAKKKAKAKAKSRKKAATKAAEPEAAEQEQAEAGKETSPEDASEVKEDDSQGDADSEEE